MRRHCPDDVAHLPHRLHHPSGDVALQRCWSAMCVVGVVSGHLWLGMAMGVGNGGDAAVAVGGGDGRWRRRRWLAWVMVVVGRKLCLFVDNDKSSIGVCQCLICGG